MRSYCSWDQASCDRARWVAQTRRQTSLHEYVYRKWNGWCWYFCQRSKAVNMIQILRSKIIAHIVLQTLFMSRTWYDDESFTKHIARAVLYSKGSTAQRIWYIAARRIVTSILTSSTNVLHTVYELLTQLKTYSHYLTVNTQPTHTTFSQTGSFKQYKIVSHWIQEISEMSYLSTRVTR